MDRILQALGLSSQKKLSQKQLLKMASNIQKSVKSVGYGEEVRQWVYVVTGFSSQYDQTRWCAKQVEGPPKVFPNYGDRTGAWASKKIDANQYIELEFQEALFISSLDIYETYHAGGVKTILGKDPAGKWRQLWKTRQVQVIHNSRVFSPPLQDLDFPIKHIRIEIDCTGCGTWVELDAVEMKGVKHKSEPPPSLEVLAEDYRKLVNDKRFSDIEFLVENKLVHAHKNILSARCDYFRAMFNDTMRECAKKCITMPDVSYHSFMGMMHYIYCNSIPNDFSGTALTELWRVADRYSIDGLRTLSLFLISNRLDVDNVVDIYVDAVTKLPVIEEVKTKCLNYMSTNMENVVMSKSFTVLPQDIMLEIIQATTAKLSISD